MVVNGELLDSWDELLEPSMMLSLVSGTMRMDGLRHVMGLISAVLHGRDECLLGKRAVVVICRHRWTKSKKFDEYLQEMWMMVVEVKGRYGLW